ncbi:metallophosphoesterase family protein [Ulvibacter litoralis]|uniref:Serine/threonine protein phosphatase 1 n=1 Tax=Ulvibacter litoralis TaxID=227084 RepID=A0A1G7DI87_9FLAO|nr:metallophosphoesterase family protein [Ulvibacter litoralis]GHC43581.1 metallophosphatase [Ulvibacter litoralis]SDE50495.1 serine/threonine protein phosphatase 1 [Ulvibacter litoralis]
MHKTYIVGDIHGGLKALQQVVSKIPKASDDLYIFLGDYVDGWSESAETVSFLLNFSETHRCIFLRGNHEELLYNFLTTQDNNDTWLAHGGAASKNSYEKLSEASLKKHLSFFEGLQNYYIDDENRLYVHAGFTNQKGPAHEFFEKMVYWDRTLWELVCSLDASLPINHPKYPKRLLHFKEIFIGHTPVTRIGETIPVNFANVWNLDTGAAFKGPLTILEVDSKKYWQSDPVYTLYPNEKGRN